MLLDGERNRSPRLSRVVLPGAVLILAAVALASFELARIVVAPPVLAAPLQTPAPSPRAQEEEKAKADQERARAVLRRQQEKLDQERAALEAEHKAAVAAFIGGQPVLSLEQKEPAVSEGELRSFLLSVAKNDSSPAVREAALSELGSLGGEEGARALASLYDESKDDGIKESILRYLAANGSKAAVEKLKAVAQSDPAEKRRVLVVRLLGSLGRPSTWFGLPPLPPEPPAPPAPPRRPPKP